MPLASLTFSVSTSIRSNMSISAPYLAMSKMGAFGSGVNGNDRLAIGNGFDVLRRAADTPMLGKFLA